MLQEGRDTISVVAQGAKDPAALRLAPARRFHSAVSVDVAEVGAKGAGPIGDTADDGAGPILGVGVPLAQEGVSVLVLCVEPLLVPVVVPVHKTAESPPGMQNLGTHERPVTAAHTAPSVRVSAHNDVQNAIVVEVPRHDILHLEVGQARPCAGGGAGVVWQAVGVGVAQAHTALHGPRVVARAQDKEVEFTVAIKVACARGLRPADGVSAGLGGVVAAAGEGAVAVVDAEHLAGDNVEPPVAVEVGRRDVECIVQGADVRHRVALGVVKAGVLDAVEEVRVVDVVLAGVEAQDRVALRVEQEHVLPAVAVEVTSPRVAGSDVVLGGRHEWDGVLGPVLLPVIEVEVEAAVVVVGGQVVDGAGHVRRGRVRVAAVAAAAVVGRGVGAQVAIAHHDLRLAVAVEVDHIVRASSQRAPFLALRLADVGESGVTVALPDVAVPGHEVGVTVVVEVTCDALGPERRVDAVGHLAGVGQSAAAVVEPDQRRLVALDVDIDVAVAVDVGEVCVLPASEGPWRGGVARRRQSKATLAIAGHHKPARDPRCDEQVVDAVAGEVGQRQRAGVVPEIAGQEVHLLGQRQRAIGRRAAAHEAVHLLVGGHENIVAAVAVQVANEHGCLRLVAVVDAGHEDRAKAEIGRAVVPPDLRPGGALVELVMHEDGVQVAVAIQVANVHTARYNQIVRAVTVEIGGHRMADVQTVHAAQGHRGRQVLADLRRDDVDVPISIEVAVGHGLASDLGSGRRQAYAFADVVGRQPKRWAGRSDSQSECHQTELVTRGSRLPQHDLLPLRCGPVGRFLSAKEERITG